MAAAHRTAPSLVIALLAVLAVACGERERAGTPGGEEISVRVASIAVDASGAPVVLLEDHRGARSLPIWIGVAEADSIAAELEHRRPPRPNTHDLARRLIDDLGGSLERVVVTDLREGTYYAVLFVSSAGRSVEVDARPSDAIALALRCGAPLFVRETLFALGGEALPPAPGERAL